MTAVEWALVGMAVWLAVLIFAVSLARANQSASNRLETRIDDEVARRRRARSRPH
jgi:hypothetical protein